MVPDDETETWHQVCRAKGYLIHENELYRRNTSGVMQWCNPVEEGKTLLLDIHKGICGHHASSRSMVRKAFGQGFYWSTAIDGATHIMRSCRGLPCDMAVCHVGPGSLGTLQESTWGLDPPAGCD
jgi:hypothetical protein